MLLGGYSETGPRETNEDSFYIRTFADINSFTNGVDSFFMVSDGMGGYQGGDIASSIVVSSAEHYLDNLLSMAKGNRIEFEPDVALSEIVQNAHEAIVAETQARGNSSMGATFVGMFASSNHAWIGHVGDSRAYLLRAGVGTQLTEDHSQVGRMLSRGMITEEEAQNHPLRNRIERALGFSDHDIEFNEVDLRPGDVLVLVSDGAYTVLGMENILSLAEKSGTADKAAISLVRAAIRNNTDDNTTAVVARVENIRSARRPRRASARAAGTSARAPLTRREGTRTRTRRQVPQQELPQEGTARSRTRPVRRRRASIVPYVLFFLALAGIVVGFYVATTADSTHVESTGQAENIASSDVEEPAAPLPSQPSQGEAGKAGTSSSQTMEYYTVVDSNARLRFLNGTDSARLFGETIVGLDVDPCLAVGQTVRACFEPTEYTDSASGERRSFYVLDDRYVEDLRSDCDQYVHDQQRPFYSELSAKIASDSYLALVDALTQSGTTAPSVDIQHIAVLGNDLSVVAGASATEALASETQGSQQTPMEEPSVGSDTASAKQAVDSGVEGVTASAVAGGDESAYEDSLHEAQ